MNDQCLLVELSLYLFDHFQGIGHLLPTRKKKSTKHYHTVCRVAGTHETKCLVLVVIQSRTKAYRRFE